MKMSAKVVFVLCASALIVNAISAQCIGNVNTGISDIPNIGISGNGLSANCGSSGLSWASNGLGLAATGLSPANLASSSGGSFTVASSSPIAPNGLSVVSDNALDGPLTVSGGLPFLSAVGMEGLVPASGASGVSYNCGNGNIGIVSETAAPVASAASAGAIGVGSGLGGGLGAGMGAARAGLGLGSPLARGFGSRVGSFGPLRGCGSGVF